MSSLSKNVAGVRSRYSAGTILVWELMGTPTLSASAIALQMVQVIAQHDLGESAINEIGVNGTSVYLDLVLGTDVDAVWITLLFEQAPRIY